jgi:hypothetical protein
MVWVVTRMTCDTPPQPRGGGRPPKRYYLPYISSAQSRGRPRGRPRLARNPVGRPPTQNLPQENPPRELNGPAVGSRGRPRGRPRLAHNPIGRPRMQTLHEGNLPREFNEPGPRFTGDDQETPLLAEDIAIKREFDEELAAEEMQRCLRCKERWFDIKLMADGVCKRCHDKDDKKRQEEPFFFLRREQP